MAEINDIVKLAVDAHKGRVNKFSIDESQDVLRQALVDANNGKTYLDYKDIRDGKCNGLFTLIEEVLHATIYDGLSENDYFNSLVETRNLALGDKNLFLVEDRTMFVVADVAEGTQGIRRQRLGGVKETSIPTQLKMVRVYEELNRVLAGRVDFNEFIDKVSYAFQQKLLNDIYALWMSATADQLGGVTYFPTAGAYDEDELLELIAHVEAAAGGQTATIIGTKKATRNLMPSIRGTMAEIAKEDLYNMGYLGKFYGSPVVITPQRHKYNSTEFILSDDVLTIIAGDEKPIKLVTEGDSIMLTKDPTTNADFTQELNYALAA